MDMVHIILWEAILNSRWRAFDFEASIESDRKLWLWGLKSFHPLTRWQSGPSRRRYSFWPTTGWA